jgi:hypothetical protein
MIQICVWYCADGSTDYIVAARGVDDAVEAFDRVAACRGHIPALCPAKYVGRIGRQLAAAHPGVIYRRIRSRPAADK